MNYRGKLPSVQLHQVVFCNLRRVFGIKKGRRPQVSPFFIAGGTLSHPVISGWELLGSFLHNHLFLDNHFVFQQFLDRELYTAPLIYIQNLDAYFVTLAEVV